MHQEKSLHAQILLALHATQNQPRTKTNHAPNQTTLKIKPRTKINHACNQSEPTTHQNQKQA